MLKSKILFFIQTFLRKLQPENPQFLLLWFESLWRWGRARKSQLWLSGSPQPLSTFLELGFCSALLLKHCDRPVPCSFHFQERRAQGVGCYVRNSKWANLLWNKTRTIFEEVILKMTLGKRTCKIGAFLVRVFAVDFLIVVWSLFAFLMKFGGIFFL